MPFPTFRLGRFPRKDTLQFTEIVGIQSKIYGRMSFLTETLGRPIVVRQDEAMTDSPHISKQAWISSLSNGFADNEQIGVSQ